MISYKMQLSVTDKYALQLRRAFLKSIKDTKSATDINWVTEQVQRGPEAVYNAIQWHAWWPVPILSKAYNEMFDKSYIEKEAGVLNPEDFVLPNPAAERWMLQYAATEVTGITGKSKEMIRNVIFEGLRDKQTNQQTAERIMNHIGLTKGQEQAVENYRKSLVKNGLPEARIKTLTNSYYNKLLNYRAETIALTESHTATTHAWVDQVQDAGRRGVFGDEYHLNWLTTPDDRLCDQCASMNGRTGSIDSGSVDGETPPLHQRCRCVLTVTKK